MSNRALLAGVVTVALATLLAACGASPVTTPSSPSDTAVPASSPVIGRVVVVDSEGLSKVRGFTLRTDAGTELAFVIGSLENGAEFPPGHLAEHLATASPVRVFFRETGGARVVYRIEDAG